MAQAGNVAVPGAAREHFVPSSIPAESESASASVSAAPSPVAKVKRPAKRKTSSRFKKRVSSALGDGDGGDDERGDKASILEGGMGIGMGIGMVDVGRGASAATPAPQRRANRGVANIDTALAEDGGSGNSNGLHARRLSPKRREHIGGL